MIQLTKEDYHKVTPLIQCHNELSVFAVLDGELPGEIWADSADQPESVLIRTCETVLLAGNPENGEFNRAIGGLLDFWESVTPDREEWAGKIQQVHPNRYIRPYTRCKYSLTRDSYRPVERPLPDGYVLEPVNPEELRQTGFTNAGRVLDWAEGWGDPDLFAAKGCGYFVRLNDYIASWSLSDCAARGRVAIGIHTAPAHRRKGLAKQAASAVLEACLAKGYHTVEWMCVSTNSGSRALAESLGFKLENCYTSFSSYAPIENLEDLDEAGWLEWGNYLSQASGEEPRLLVEELYCMIKANQPELVRKAISKMKKQDQPVDMERLEKDIAWFRKMGICSAFDAGWNDIAAG
ncbi:GNAT family N-acetyltransferase [Paenibacillus tepidiphilus]|uniref:GNAT family N-acetyltransferase n=1 Tax=Paenibacillus tepidiphilus TaxID=2608683 RepID=UPI00123A9251|nr:GNAT family N-acetyltransferase [Paenibacillus tepidiphilus]